MRRTFNCYWFKVRKARIIIAWSEKISFHRNHKVSDVRRLSNVREREELQMNTQTAMTVVQKNIQSSLNDGENTMNGCESSFTFIDTEKTIVSVLWAYRKRWIKRRSDNCGSWCVLSMMQLPILRIQINTNFGLDEAV